MKQQIPAMKLALEALLATLGTHDSWQDVCDLKDEAITALRQAIEQAEQDHTYGYAKQLAETIFKQHFASDEHYASGRIVWGVNDTVIGILTQIDNMVADMVRKSEQAQKQEPDKYVMDIECTNCGTKQSGILTVNTTSPQRQPLTDERILAIARDHYNPHQRAEISFARAIEAAHGITGEKK